MANSIHENDERKLADRFRREAVRFRPEFSEILHERIVERIADEHRPTPRRPKTRRTRLLTLTAMLSAVSLAALSLMICWPGEQLETHLGGQTPPGDTVREGTGGEVPSIPGPVEDPGPRPPSELAHEPRLPLGPLEPRPNGGILSFADLLPHAVAGQMELLMKGTFGQPLGELEHDLDHDARIAADRIMARLPLEMLAISEEQ